MSTEIRNTQRGPILANNANSEKHAQRSHSRARKRGEDVVCDPAARIRSGQRVNCRELRIPQVLQEIEKDNLFTDSVLRSVLSYVHNNVFAGVYTEIDIKWDDTMDENTPGYCEPGYMEDSIKRPQLIRICRRAVRTKVLIYLVVGYELAHKVCHAGSVCSHEYHGNASIKILEKLL